MLHRITAKATVLTLLLILVIIAGIPKVYSVTWSPDMRLTWNISYDWYPSIAQCSDGRIWVSWHSYRTGNNEIFYKIYNPSQVHPWSPDIQLTTDPSQDVESSVMQAADGRIWVAWASNRIGNYEVYYKINNGASWLSDTRLTTDPNADEFPSMMQATDGTIWVFWSSNRTGNEEIFYKTSSDNGASWSSDTQLTTYASANDWDPAVTQASDGRIWLVWTRNDDIYYQIYNGVFWTSTTRIVYDPSFDWHPSVMQASDGSIWIAWDTDRAVSNDIYYKSSPNGISWSLDTPLVTNVEQDDMPSLLRAADGTTWLTWASSRNGNVDIYYISTSTLPSHDLAVFSVASSSDVVLRGQTVNVEVVAQNHGAQFEIFNIYGYAHTTLIGVKENIGLSPGQLYVTVFQWNTSSVAAGIYTLSAQVSVVSGETNTADNTYVDGDVAVVFHDVAVKNVSSFPTFVYGGYPRNIDIDVEVKNNGNFSETFSVSVYYNSTLIETQEVASLAPGAIDALVFTWNPEGMPYGFYSLSASASAVSGEVDPANNSLADGTVTVTIAGDVNGDRTINVLDLAVLSSHWFPGPPVGTLGYDLNVDINDDGSVNILDLGISSGNWNHSW